MKYRYKLVIEDATKDEEILIMQGYGVSRSLAGCYKSVRRTITQGIKKYIDKASLSPTSPKCPEALESKNG